MALAKCRECRKDVSTEAMTCPHCGIARPTSAPHPSSSVFQKPPPVTQAPPRAEPGRPERTPPTPAGKPSRTPPQPTLKWEETWGPRIALLILDIIGGLILLFMFFPLFIVFGLLGLAVALIARSKGRDTFWWWIYGFGLWFIALPHALLMKPDVAGIEGRRMAEGQRKCPFCAEMVKLDAKVCRHCGRDLPAMPAH
jgi:RNA polymerase subunit RPABC4/transcription elongation factor Spt4